MPVRIAEVAGGAGVALVCHGDVAFADIIEAKKSVLLPDPKLRSWMFGLFDLSNVKSADYSPEELRAIATADETLASITRKDLVVAIVAPQDLQFGLARMWQAFADAIRWQTMVFRNLDDAELWIRKKVAENFGSDLPSFRDELSRASNPDNPATP